jgi:hypothetical protein
MLIGRTAPVVKAPKWLKGMVICPVLIGGHLWWDCAPYFMVRGGPPSGVAFDHSDPHVLPDNFGPSGRPTQVVPDVVDISGTLILRDQLGDVRARCLARHFKLANEMQDEGVLWFVYPSPDPDNDLKPPLVGVIRRQVVFGDEAVDHFMAVAFISQVAISMHNFLSQEQIGLLPVFSGTGNKEDSDG